MPNFYKQMFFGAIFDFQHFQTKAPFGHHFRVAGRPKPTTPNSGERPCRDPGFHEIIAIIVPFGPSVFLNVIFSMKICNFSVFSAFLCAMFYMIFYHFCC